MKETGPLQSFLCQTHWLQRSADQESDRLSTDTSSRFVLLEFCLPGPCASASRRFARSVSRSSLLRILRHRNSWSVCWYRSFEFLGRSHPSPGVFASRPFCWFDAAGLRFQAGAWSDIFVSECQVDGWRSKWYSLSRFNCRRTASRYQRWFPCPESDEVRVLPGEVEYEAAVCLPLTGVSGASVAHGFDASPFRIRRVDIDSSFTPSLSLNTSISKTVSSQARLNVDTATADGKRYLVGLKVHDFACLVRCRVPMLVILVGVVNAGSAVVCYSSSLMTSIFSFRFPNDAMDTATFPYLHNIAHGSMRSS